MSVELNGQAIDILLVEDNPGDARLAQVALKDSKVRNSAASSRRSVPSCCFPSRARMRG